MTEATEIPAVVQKQPGEGMAERPNIKELCELADMLLAENGFTRWGQPRSKDSAQQASFDYRMRTGAYSGERR